MCSVRENTSFFETREAIGPVTRSKGSEELRERELHDGGDRGSSEAGPVTSINTLVDQEMSKTPHTSILAPLSPICSLQATLSGCDPPVFKIEETSTICQVQAATWSTCATISAPLGDNREIGVVLRHHRSAQPVEFLQATGEEAEAFGQCPKGGLPRRGSKLVHAAPLFLWVRELSSLNPILRALMYMALFAMFCLMAFVCDLPICLAIYLLSLCWWCCHSEKQPLPVEKKTD